MQCTYIVSKRFKLLRRTQHKAKQLNQRITSTADGYNPCGLDSSYSHRL